MKKIFSIVFIGFLFISPLKIDAHELIPKELKVFLENNPNATDEEIQQFAKDQTPEFAEKFKDGVEIVEVVRNQDSSLLDNMYDFFKLGIEHILDGPDHILFVLSLLLVFISWKEIFKIITTFTLAHSITLILAGTGLLTLSSKIVEPIIALSIAYVAITSVFFKNNPFVGKNIGKIAAVFFFGLFHGLGFAGLLQEIQIPSDKFISSLLAFNLGIEAGQIATVLIAFPFIYFVRNKSWYPKVIKIFAVLISLIAVYWFFERIFG